MFRMWFVPTNLCLDSHFPGSLDGGTVRGIRASVSEGFKVSGFQGHMGFRVSWFQGSGLRFQGFSAWLSRDARMAGPLKTLRGTFLKSSI